MTDLCAQCPQPHLYKTYVMVGGFPVWFCGPRCKNIWLVHDRPDSGKKLHLLVLAVLIFTGVTFKAWGAPPEGSSLRDKDFFNALTAPNGASCCSEADCRYIENENWRIKDGHFEVFIESAWVAVPKDKVLDRNKSPQGKPVLCRSGTTIYCFAPDVLT